MAFPLFRSRVRFDVDIVGAPMGSSYRLPARPSAIDLARLFEQRNASGANPSHFTNGATVSGIHRHRKVPMQGISFG